MATAVLLIWPVITLIMFKALGPPRGLIWSVVIGYLFLPENFVAIDLPIVDYEKFFAISFSAALATLLIRETPRDGLRRVKTPMPALMFFLLAVLLLVSPVGTYITNPEALVNGPTIRPGLSGRDILADMALTLIQIAPLLLAWRLLTQPEHHRELLIAILAVGFVYTFFVLFERRMSPQLNVWFYGYFPHNWIQHNRGGGFRPLVFLRHGLWLGFFLFTVVIAALALSRDREVRNRALLPFLALWALLVLFLSRNLGATMLAVLFAPLMLFLPFLLQARITAILAVVIVIYPALHDVMEVPMNRFLDFVSGISAERAQSFQVRLENESELLARANEQPLFGWGAWGRMRIINEFGVDVSLVDGAWIVQKGTSGWVGYIGFFGLLTLPVIFAGRAARRKPITPAVGGMMVMMAGNFLYIIPNSTLNPIAFLVLGAMAAFAQYDLAENRAEVVDTTSEPERQVQYSRFTAGVASPQQAAADQGLSPHRRPVSTPYSSRSRRKSGA